MCFIVRELKSGFPKLREVLIPAVTGCYRVSQPPLVFLNLPRGVRFQIGRKSGKENQRISDWLAKSGRVEKKRREERKRRGKTNLLTIRGKNQEASSANVIFVLQISVNSERFADNRKFTHVVYGYSRERSRAVSDFAEIKVNPHTWPLAVEYDVATSTRRLVIALLIACKNQV